ncbi:MAG: response regulator [Anaerolineales bacterium]
MPGRVLVIDDEEHMRRLIRRQLERAGFEVAQAASAKEGLRMMRELKPDAVTIDLMMPEIGGLEMLAEKDSDPGIRDVPALVLTAVGWQEDLERAIELGARAVLLKPFSQQELARAVVAIMRVSTDGGETDLTRISP